MMGAARAYSFELTMPGGALVSVAAVSAVAVQPSHRRRGVLSSMIAAFAGRPGTRRVAAALTASEGAIYGRFGYGPATWRLGATIDRLAPATFRARSRLRLCAHRHRGARPTWSFSRCTRTRRAPRAWSRVPSSGGPRCSGSSRSRGALSRPYTLTSGVARRFRRLRDQGRRGPSRRRRPLPRRSRPAGDDLGAARCAVGVPVRR